MSVAELRQLEAGGFVAANSDADASATEDVVARRNAISQAPPPQAGVVSAETDEEEPDDDE